MSIAEQLRVRVVAAATNLMDAAAKEAALSTAEVSPTPETGDLARSIAALPTTVSGSTLSAVLVATAQYASYTDTGNDPGGGRIYGNPLLRFFWILGPQGPGVYYFRSVKAHPGTQWWISHHPDRWTEALRRASAQGAFSR